MSHGAICGWPSVRAAWWSMGLGLAALLLLVVKSLLPGIGFSLGELNVVPAVALLLGLAALPPGIAAFRRGERSFILWIGLGTGSLFALVLVAELTVLE